MNNNIQSNVVQSNINQDVQVQPTENKKNLKILLVVILAILVIGCVILFLIMNNDSSNKVQVLVYTNNDNDLKYVSSKNGTPILLSKSFEEKINVKFNENNTKLAYIKNRGLYLHNINSKEDSDKIGVDVDTFKFINKKELIYLDVNKNLYIASSSNDKNRIDIDVTKIIYDKNDTIIYNKGEEVYLYNTVSKEKNSILKDYDSNKKIYVSKDLKQILYISQNSELKIYDVDNKTSKVKTTDVYDIIDYSDDFTSIVYTTLGENKKYYDLFINDNPADNPIVKYQCTMHEMFEDSNTGVQTSDTDKNIYHLYADVDFYIYYDKNGDWHNVTLELYNYCKGADPSAELKEQIRKDETSVQLYDVYSLNNDESKEISKNIYEVITSKDDTVVYTKLDISNENKVKISSISSTNDIKDLINQVKPTLYYSNNAKNDELLVNGFDTKYKDNIDVVNGKIYVYEINDKNELSLYEYDTSTSNKEKLSSKGFILDTNVMDYDVLYLDNFNAETLKGDLIGRTNSKNTNIDIDVYSVIETDNNNLYYYKDFDFSKLNGSFIINNISKDKKDTINDVSVVLKGLNNKYYIFKDYSTTSKTYSLFLYEKGNQTPIEYNVTSYVYSD